MKCGGSKGYSYYFEGGMIAAKDAGWSEDRISTGQIIFILKGDKPQLLVGDVAGMRDVESDGANLAVAQSNANTIVLLVAYPGATETYAFRIKPDGRGEVVWSSIKAAGAIDRGTMMQASCELTG